MHLVRSSLATQREVLDNVQAHARLDLLHSVSCTAQVMGQTQKPVEVAHLGPIKELH